MLNPRTAILGLFSLAAVALSGEARASCAAVEGCVCTFQSDLIATFTGTIVEGGGAAFSDPSSVKVRIDEVSRADGSSSQLEAGSVTDAKVDSLEVGVKTGDRVLGYSTLTCADPSKSCTNKPMDTEVLGVRAVLDATGLVPCGSFTPFSPLEAREFLLDPQCEGALQERLGLDAPACNDVACLCSAPGKRSADSASAVAGFLALLGVWRLRRSRR